jgi:hypothetical protein
MGLSGTEDPALLEWAAGAGRILLTHDRRTVPRFASDRLAAGCGGEADWRDQVTYSPL